jgi:hypothetical protein
MIPWLQGKALGLIAAAIPLGLLASMGYQFVKKLLEKETHLLDKVPAAMHKVYFGLTAAVLTAIAGALGVTLECPETSCLEAVTQEHVRLALQALIAIVVGQVAHSLKKKVGA